MLMLRRISPLILLAVLLVVYGCGSSSKSSSTAGPAGSGGQTTAAEGAGALAADAKSAATGDIPDTQNFLTLRDRLLRVSMLYPEGWTVQEHGSAGVSIQDKNNLVRIVLSRGRAPTTASVDAQLTALGRSTSGLTHRPAQTISLNSGPAVKATYTTRSAPNAVTGKQVTLTVDRYALFRGGRVATVDLGTPVGVDNVDAYKRMIESFKWR
jgi:hypothetical protein